MSSVQRLKSATKRGILAVAPPLRRMVDSRNDAKAEAAKWRRKSVKLQERLDQVNSDAAMARLATPEHDTSDDLGYLFIVTYGRSGSTLLQGILTSIPGYDIKGENRDALHHLFKYHQQLEANREKYASGKRLLDQRHPFYGADLYAADATFAYLRSMVVNTLLQPPPGTRVTGFKEIRWLHDDWEEYIPFLQRVFPGAKFIINSRKHEDVVKSLWWTNHADPMARVAKYEAQHAAIGEYLGDQAYHVHYDDYVADHDVLKGLFDWLGEDFDRETVDRVMDTKHSVGPTPEHLRKDKG